MAALLHFLLGKSKSISGVRGSHADVIYILELPIQVHRVHSWIMNGILSMASRPTLRSWGTLLQPVNPLICIVHSKSCSNCVKCYPWQVKTWIIVHVVSNTRHCIDPSLCLPLIFKDGENSTIIAIWYGWIKNTYLYIITFICTLAVYSSVAWFTHGTVWHSIWAKSTCY
jgi:hypothetical protein